MQFRTITAGRQAADGKLLLLKGATVGLYVQGTNYATLATGVKNKNGDAQNPVPVDENGQAVIGAPNGIYDVRISYAGGLNIDKPGQYWSDILTTPAEVVAAGELAAQVRDQALAAKEAVMGASTASGVAYWFDTKADLEAALEMLQDGVYGVGIDESRSNMRTRYRVTTHVAEYQLTENAAGSILLQGGENVEDAIIETLRRVPNVVAARAINSAYPKTIFIDSLDGGLFRRDPNDKTSAEDGGDYCGTIIRSADYATRGVWVREGRETLPDHFGCFVEQNANNGPQLRNFWAALKNRRLLGRALPGRYYADYFDIPSGIDFRGAGQRSFGLGNKFGAWYVGTWFVQHSSSNEHFACFETLQDADGYDRVGPLSIKNFGLLGRYDAGKMGLVVRSRDLANTGLDNDSSARKTIIQSLTVIENIMIRNFGSHGWWAPAGHGGVHICNIHGLFNGGFGGFLDCSFGSQETTELSGIDGDGNLGGGTLCVYKLGSSVEADKKYSALIINGLRAEKRINLNTGTTGNDNVLVLDNCRSGVVLVNGLLHQSTAPGSAPGDAIKLINQPFGFAPTVIYTGLEISAKSSQSQLPSERGYALNDTVNGKTFAADVPNGIYSRTQPYRALQSASPETVKPWDFVGAGAPWPVSVASGGYQVIGTIPAYVLVESDAGSNAKVWAETANAGQLLSRAFSDDGVSFDVFRRVSRSGEAVTLVEYLRPFRFNDSVTFQHPVMNMTALPTFADNAAAVSGGLAVGRVYKTPAGDLRIVV